MTTTRVPPILGLVAIGGLLWVANARAPGIVPAVLLLVALYLVLTNVEGFADLVASGPGALRSLYNTAPIRPRVGGP